MKTAELLKAIAATQASIADARAQWSHAKDNIFSQEIDEPYCYLLPLAAFMIGYQFNDKIKLSSMLLLITELKAVSNI